MRAALVAALLVAQLACARREEAPVEEAPRTPPMSEAEAGQVRDACTGYVAEVCRCAAATTGDAALAEECALARAIPDALVLAIRSAQARQDSEIDARGVRANVGAIQKNCVEKSARVALRCPPAR